MALRAADAEQLRKAVLMDFDVDIGADTAAKYLDQRWLGETGHHSRTMQCLLTGRTLTIDSFVDVTLFRGC